MAERKMLAIDVGTSSVRTFLGAFDGETLAVCEKRRFFNGPIETPSSVCWDMLGIYQRLASAAQEVCAQDAVESLALDAWGTDMVAIDRHGELLTNGICTRDTRFNGIKEVFFRRMDRHVLYRKTGIQFLNWNTLYLLFDMFQRRPWISDAADKLLFAPDCFNYLLTGEKICDYTIASTSQMLNPYSKQWDEEILRAAGIPSATLLNPTLGLEIGKTRHMFGGKQLTVYSGCGHDTAAAVAGIPALGDDFVYIVCGSWAMIGTQTENPIISESSERHCFSNEGGVDGRIRFLRNVMGMWLMQESRREWLRRDRAYSFSELSQLGEQARPFGAIIDVDDPRLRLSGNIPGTIQCLCSETGEHVPQTVGEIVRCIGDSLALKFRFVKEQIDQCCARRFSTIHIVAGGSQDSMLCQTIADATGCTVCAGPVEASIYGNCSVQLMQSGLAANLSETREIMRRSLPLARYEPHANPALEEAYGCHQALFYSTVG